MAEILIVDDDFDIATSLGELLQLDGHRVRTACDGLQGLARLKERAADVVLLDVEMPRLDGPGLAYAMFLHDLGLDQIPVILVSGVDELAAVAARVGTPYRVGKPFAVEELTRVLELALRERVAPAPHVAPAPPSR